MIIDLYGTPTWNASKSRDFGVVLPGALLILLASVVPLGGQSTADEPAETVERSYSIDSFRVALELQDGGDYLIEERITFTYQGGTFSQGFRRIPKDGLDSLTGLRVTSPDADVVSVEVMEGRRAVEAIWDFPARDAPATFVIRYRVTGSLQEVEGRNRIVWDAVGTDWDVPVRNLDIVFAWPDFDLERGEIRVMPAEEAFVTATEDGWEARFAPADLAAGQPYGIQVEFPARLDGRDPPPSQEDRGAMILAVLAGLIVGALPGAALAISWRSPGDPPTPLPHGLPAATLPEAGYLVSGLTFWGHRVFTAVLIDLARRGHVHLVPRDHSTADGIAAVEGTLQVVRVDGRRARIRDDADDSLSPLETRLLDAIDEHDSYQEFLANSTRHQTHAYRDTRNGLAAAGLLEENRSTAFRTVWASVGLAAVLAFAVWLTSGLVSGALLGAAVGVAPPLWISAGQVRWRRTGAGARLRAHLRQYLSGLRETLEHSIDTEPAQAARHLAEHFPWMVLDPRTDHRVIRRLEEALDHSDQTVELPRWLRSAVGDPGAASPGDDGMAGFLVVLWVMHSSRVPASGTDGTGTGGFSGGAGVSTGVGGGGGGMR